MPASNILDKTGVLKTLPKFKLIMNPKSYRMAHPIYQKTDIETIKKYHHEPENWKDRLALAMVRSVRGGFDKVSRYNPETMNERDWLSRQAQQNRIFGNSRRCSRHDRRNGTTSKES